MDRVSFQLNLNCMLRILKKVSVDWWIIVFLIISASIISTLTYQNHSGIFSDSLIYIDAANSWAHGFGFNNFLPTFDKDYLYYPLTVFGPLYPLLTAITIKLLSLSAIDAGRVVSLLSYIISVIPFYFIVNRIFKSRLVAFLSSVLFVIHRPAI